MQLGTKLGVLIWYKKKGLDWRVLTRFSCQDLSRPWKKSRGLADQSEFTDRNRIGGLDFRLAVLTTLNVYEEHNLNLNEISSCYICQTVGY